jgi:hypothetical protein
MSNLLKVIGVSLLFGASTAQAQESSPDMRLVMTKDSLALVVPEIQFPLMGRMTPPTVYSQWWLDVMRCSGLTMPAEARASVKYYWVLGHNGFAISWIPASRGRFDGYSEVWSNRMYLNLDGATNPNLVKHEMLHFLMYHNGITAGHPKRLFVDRCGLSSK